MTPEVPVTADCPVELPPATQSTGLNPVIEKYELALLMLLGFAGFSMLIGIAYNNIRRYVFKDFHSLDVIFDAGGRVSVSLTAVTVTSQLIWPADFLQSPTIASKVGISGSLFYTLAIVLSVLIFAVLCIQLKTRAPGAKTFPQIAYVRFGKNTHILFCVVALFTNMVITANLILAGKAAVEVLSKDASNEFTLMILAVLFGSYCLIGGLGTTFYISYFNTALIFITTSLFILKITYLAEPEVEAVTSHKSLYDAMSCLKGPDGNKDNSFLTFRSESGIIYRVVTLFMTIAVVFCDQANWQSRIAAKPREGMLGFLIAAFLWYAIPTSVSFVTSMTYKTMSFQNGTNLLTAEEIDEGYITPYVVQTLLGKEGCFVLLTLMTMTLMSTGSGEVMSVSSVLVYDIIKTHITPFRPGTEPTDCVLCGNSKIPISKDNVPRELCDCPSVVDCKLCDDDIKDRLSGKAKPGFQYKCPVHGQYRHYEDQLMQYKSWCMIWVVIAIIPFGLLIIGSGMNLNWAFLASQVFIAPFILPLYFTIGWAGVTSKGLISGGIIGLLCSVSGMLGYGSTYDGGLSDFYTNTAQDYSLLMGLISGVVVSAVITVVVSLCDRKSKKKVAFNKQFPIGNPEHGTDKIMEEKLGFLEIEWLKTMSIDNPLNPYRTIYRKELKEINADRILTIHHMEAIFRKTRLLSITGVVVSFVVFLVVVPGVALGQEVLTEIQLGTWISVCQHWCLIATVFVVIIPPLQEGIQIWRQYKKNKKFVQEHTDDVSMQVVSK
ncbi:uncharacterized protein LOC123557720 isoform X1 [Mercenaria mercenaria]|uniref:uncharacterized protein LOC123557720 isoform X1 n=1 Tax=Mercenaria mercenaria TaxID=6596 RepID=UPI00234EAEAF|nr:uncharacterized protein LOC123557720 isoform X1 [Mercenaria mercenaria]